MREPFWELFESQVQTQNIENFLIPRYKHKILRTLWRTFWVPDKNTKYWEIFESQLQTQNIESSLENFFSPIYKPKYWEHFGELFESQIQTQNIENSLENFLSPRYKCATCFLRPAPHSQDALIRYLGQAALLDSFCSKQIRIFSPTSRGYLKGL